MRLAVYENLPPGGALRASYEIGVQLARRGHELHLYRLSTYADKGPFDLASKASSVHVTQFRPLRGLIDARLRAGHLFPRSYTLFGPLRRAHRQIARAIKEGGYDAVLLHTDAMTYAPYALRWLDGCATVYYCEEPPRFVFEDAVRRQHRRNLMSSQYGVGLLRALEDRLVLGRLAREDAENARHAGTIVVNSVFSRERAWAAYSRQATVCYLGIDPDVFSPASGAAVRRSEVLVVGSPTAAKNYELVFEALAILPAEKRPRLRAVIPSRSGATRLESLARDSGVELAVDAGLSEAELVERYRCAIATIGAARLEPFGLTAVESMACGTPVIAVREGGFRESVVDGVTGLLVEPVPNAMASAISQLSEDPSRAQELGRAGRELVLQRWTWERTGRQMEEILLEAART